MGPIAAANRLHFLGDEANALLAIKINLTENGCGIGRSGHLLVVLELCIATAIERIRDNVVIARAVLVCCAE